jgi:hypothetical protein
MAGGGLGAPTPLGVMIFFVKKKEKWSELSEMARECKDDVINFSVFSLLPPHLIFTNYLFS